ncbi:PKD domain-containing protein, partial [bacterium]|nr:PKD domain-containing protein [bacterium]
KLIIDVYDWQGSTTHAEPVIECPELFNDTLTATWFEDGPVYSRYEVTVSNALLADVGDYMCLVSVEANENDPVGTWWLGLTAYQIPILTVTELVTENPVAVATADPNPQTAGLPVHFSGLDSYDPDGGDIQLYEWDWDNDGIYDTTGSEADNMWPSAGTYLVQLRVTDDEGVTDELDVPMEIVIMGIEVISPNGGEKWQAGCNREITWISVNLTDTVFIDYSTDNFVSDINSLATDEANDSSFMWENIPSDYSDTVRVRVSSTDYPGVNDVSDENFSIVEVFGWARTWGDTGNDYGYEVAVDFDDNVYIAGNISSGGYSDASLFKYDPCGVLLWAKTWDGTNVDNVDRVCGVAADGSGNVYVTGRFQNIVDFNPDGGDPRTSNGNEDVFLSKF